MEVAADVVVDVALLLLDLFGLIAEDSVFVPSFGEREGGVDQRVSFEKLRLAIGLRLFVFLFALSQVTDTL
jgi:hypothetical protein